MLDKGASDRASPGRPFTARRDCMRSPQASAARREAITGLSAFREAQFLQLPDVDLEHRFFQSQSIGKILGASFGPGSDPFKYLQ
jgi:hypothetical protein